MKRMLAITTLVLLGSVCAFAQASQQPPAPQPATSPAEKPKPTRAQLIASVKRSQKQAAEAALKQDFKYWERHEAHDYRFIDPSGKVTNREQDLETVKSGVVKFEKFEIVDMEVRIYGNIAIVVGELDIKGTAGGQDISGRYRYTDVLQSRGSRWVFLNSQLTAIPK